MNEELLKDVTGVALDVVQSWVEDQDLPIPGSAWALLGDLLALGFAEAFVDKFESDDIEFVDGDKSDS